LCGVDHFSHVYFRKGTLWRSRDEVLLRWVFGKVFTKSVDQCDVSLRGIGRSVFNIKVEAININVNVRICAEVATVEWSDSAIVNPRLLERSIASPQKIGKIFSVGGTSELIILRRSTKGDQDLLA
jgi:hypothetical protein